MPKNILDKHFFFKPLREVLIVEFGSAESCQIWAESSQTLDIFLHTDPSLEKQNGALVLPLVALYRTLEAHGKDAEGLLNTFGDRQGERFAKIVHTITSIPGLSKLLWKNIDRIMERMSGPGPGYQRRIVSKPPEMYGVDILSFPYHEMAKEMGTEKAVLCICHMDKKYMQGFRYIRYERNTAVSEGAACCDYRLRFDQEKE